MTPRIAPPAAGLPTAKFTHATRPLSLAKGMIFIYWRDFRAFFAAQIYRLSFRLLINSADVASTLRPSASGAMSLYQDISAERIIASRLMIR